MIDPGFVERVANKVAEVLLKREADLKYQSIVESLQAKQRDNQELREQAKANFKALDEAMKADQEGQANCKHDKKFIHDITHSVFSVPDNERRWTRCVGCQKVWKEPIPGDLKKCKHEKSLQALCMPDGCEWVRCGTCCKTWKD